MSKGKTVFHNFDQDQLDEQYNNRARFPNFEEHFDAWQRWSADTRSRLPCHIDVAFGSTEDEKIDVFPAQIKGAPIYVFIHGGYWYSLDKENYSYTAEGLRPHGITTIVNNFGLAPAHSMGEIVRQNRQAVAHIWRNAHQWGADRDRIYVSGHSAGGHLAALLLATDWAAYEADLPGDLVKGACAIGGIFDLEPIRLSFLNKNLNLTEQDVADHSPLKQVYPVSAPLLLIVAADESDEFHRQSEEMAGYWKGLGYPVELSIPKGLDHFDVVNELGDPSCPLVELQLRHMQNAFGGLPASSA